MSIDAKGERSVTERDAFLIRCPRIENEYQLRLDCELVVSAIRTHNAWNVRLRRADGRAMTIARLNGIPDLDTFFDKLPDVNHEPKSCASTPKETTA